MDQEGVGSNAGVGHSLETGAPRVIVVGAGPVGLLTALRLAKAGIRTVVLEALPAIEESPRAMAYQPIAVKELDRVGVLDDCRLEGCSHTKICWRKTKNEEVIAEMERQVTPENPYENLLLGQHLLAKIIFKHLGQASGEVLFEHKVIAVEKLDEKEGVKVTCELADGSQKMLQAKYLIAADGGRSTVRKLLGIDFEGFTWPEQLVSTNVKFPFEDYGWYPGNFMCDKDHWALVGKINMQGLWRVSYGETSGLTDEQLRERLPMKFDAMFPGPKPANYKLVQFSPYKLNQRCASTFRDGPILLAGDAAHLCNPFGGLGLTGGILDAAALADALIARLQRGVPDSILDKYAQVRRDIFLNVVNPASIANKRRLHEFDVDTLGETDSFLRQIRSASVSEQQQIRGSAVLAVDILEGYK